MNIEARPYQQEAVADIMREFRIQFDALLVMSCGLGKTETSFLVIDEFPKDAQIMFAIHRVKLVAQTVKRAQKTFGDEVGEVCITRGANEHNKRITIGSVQSLVRVDKPIDFLIIDECHRLSLVEESSYMRLIAKLRLKNPKMKVLGLTATPWRPTGKIYGEEKSLFRKVTYQKDLLWAIKNGYLVVPRMKRPDEQFNLDGIRILAGDYDQGALELRVMNEAKIKAQIADALARLKDRKKIVWACVSIAHAELVHKLIIERGEKASLIHSKMDARDQERSIDAFENSDTRHMVFVTIVSEGYDYPPVDGIVFMRPTRSPVLYIQIVGRGLRLSPGKIDCLVLDYGRVVENCGPIDNPRIPGARAGSKTYVPPTKFCPKCLEYLAISVDKCPVCAYEFPQPKPDPVKNLTARAADGSLLSISEEWLAVRDVQITSHKASSGRQCIAITYVQQNWLKLPVREYAVFDDTKPWLNRKSSEKLLRFGIEVNNEQEAKKWVETNYKARPKRMPSKIKVKTGGQFPEIMELGYEQQNRDPKAADFLARR